VVEALVQVWATLAVVYLPGAKTVSHKHRVQLADRKETMKLISIHNIGLTTLKPLKEATKPLSNTMIVESILEHYKRLSRAASLSDV